MWTWWLTEGRQGCQKKSADMELDMVAVMEVDKVADMVDDMPWIFFMDDFFQE